MVKTVVLCLDSDLHNDARKYAVDHNFKFTIDYNVAKREIPDNGVLILYLHGVYKVGDGGLIVADNKVIVKERAEAERTLDPVQFADFLKASVIRPGLSLSIIVHACFSAGSLEYPPTIHDKLTTFAGQLCSSLSSHCGELSVTGYRGQTKSGFAGYSVIPPAEPRRAVTRSRGDPHVGDRWIVEYGKQSDGVEVRREGAAIVWRV